jgi:hypothetical protein
VGKGLILTWEEGGGMKNEKCKRGKAKNKFKMQIANSPSTLLRELKCQNV